MGGTKTYIYGRTGTPLKINGEGEASVVVHPHPPVDEKIYPIPFRQYFTTTGLSTGSSNMVVDGSVTPVDFYIIANPDYDIYIKTISVDIEDTGTPTLNLFGALAALTNGIEWSYFTQNEGFYILHEGIKSNKEFIRTGIKTGAIGTGAASYLADTSGGGEKSYLPYIDISESFGMPWGLRLKKGSTDKLIFKVKDAMAGLTSLNIIGYGIRF